jgi:hypothetical protein
MVKPDVVMVSTVPDAPPAAGPDRALDPPPPAAVEEGVAVVEGDVAFAEGDVPQPANSAITAHVDAAAMIQPRLGFMWSSLGGWFLRRILRPLGGLWNTVEPGAAKNPT